MEQDISIGAVVLNKKGLVLLLDRTDKNDNFWEFPKGHQKIGETELDTLKRELLEETGIVHFKIIEGILGRINMLVLQAKRELFDYM